MERSQAVWESICRADVREVNEEALYKKTGLKERLLEMLASMEELTPAQELIRQTGVNCSCSRRSLPLL
jgi:hypothetical protein